MSNNNDSFLQNLIPDIDRNGKTKEELKHSIKDRKRMAIRWTSGIVAGAAIGIGLYTFGHDVWNIDIPAAAVVGIASAIATKVLVKNSQSKRLNKQLGIKKHGILKRVKNVAYGRSDDRPTLVDNAFLIAGIAPIAIPLITGADANMTLILGGLTAYAGKRIFNSIKDNKNNKEKERTR